MGVYHVYLSGSSSNPVWTYKTWYWLSKRLDHLAKHTALARCTVVVDDEHGTLDIPVELMRGAGQWEWWTHGATPIPYQPDTTLLAGISSRKMKSNRHGL